MLQGSCWKNRQENACIHHLPLCTCFAAQDATERQHLKEACSFVRKLTQERQTM